MRPKGHAGTADHPGGCPGQNILETKNSRRRRRRKEEEEEKDIEKTKTKKKKNNKKKKMKTKKKKNKKKKKMKKKKKTTHNEQHVSHDVDGAVLVGITDVLQDRRVNGAAKQLQVIIFG